MYWHISSRLHTDRPVDLSLGPKKDICPKGGLRTAARRPTCRATTVGLTEEPYQSTPTIFNTEDHGDCKRNFFCKSPEHPCVDDWYKLDGAVHYHYAPKRSLQKCFYEDQS